MPSTESTLDRLRRWAEASPEKIALQDDHSTLRFGELDARLAQVARAVTRNSAEIRPGHFVPVVVDRTVDSAVAVLACLAYRIPFFPVDARAHESFARALLARVGSPEVALVTTPLHPLSPEVRPIEPLDDGHEPARASSSALDADEALVIFTSGSTGEPKGVVFDWQGLDRRWRYRDSLAPADRSAYRQALVAPLDALWALTLLADVAAGCSVLLIDPARLRPIDFLRRLAEFGPSHLPLPAQLGRILSQLPDDACVPLPTVTHLSVGSEGFHYEFMRGLHRILPSDAIVTHNLATTEGGRMLHHEIRLGAAPASGVMPVGLPAFPADIRFRPVAEMENGVAEVVVGGAIATGYLGDPERTAQRFSVDDEGRRWWSSGDLVERGPDGLYRHHGRVDDIVKVRGKLASPSDITAVLLQVPGVKAAITLPVTQDHNVRLVAHVQLEPDAETTLTQIRAALAERLPAHLQPAAVLRHVSLPINARGKIDRQAVGEGPFEPWPPDSE